MHQGYYRRGCALRELLRDEEALVALREAAELAPSDAEIRNKLAEVLQRGTYNTRTTRSSCLGFLSFSLPAHAVHVCVFLLYRCQSPRRRAGGCVTLATRARTTRTSATAW